jgi:hypothetical protein
VMHAALLMSWSPTFRSAITIGFIGGLTTYSSSNYETARLLEERAIEAAALNATATIAGRTCADSAKLRKSQMSWSTNAAARMNRRRQPPCLKHQLRCTLIKGGHAALEDSQTRRAWRKQPSEVISP